MSGARVVHVVKVRGIAGAETHLLALLPALAARGLEVHALVLGPRRPTAAFLARLAGAGIPCERVPIRMPLDPLTVAALARRLRRLRPALVHTHLVHADVHGQEAARIARVPHRVSSRHNTDPFRRRTAVRLLDDRALRTVGRVIAISRAVARFTVEVEGADPSVVRTVPYGLDRPPTAAADRDRARRRLGVPDDAAVVGAVARAVPQKGLDVLLRAAPRVLAEHPGARLVVVGDGPLRRGLERLAERLGIASSVRFTGWVDDAADLMPAFDLVAVPSRWEGLGLVALEAMAAGRAVVASRVDALEEVVEDGRTGLLVPPEQPGAVADAIGSLLAEPARAAALGAAGRRRLEAVYTVERMVDGTVAVYGELLRTAGDRSEPSAGS